MEVFSNTFNFVFTIILWPYNPTHAVTCVVWALSLSLATTQEITIVFFSSAYLDVSVQRVSAICDHKWPGFPIRKSTDQNLSAVPRSLSQLDTSFIASKTQGIPHTPLVTYYLLKSWFSYFLSTCQRTLSLFVSYTYTLRYMV